MFLGLGGLLVVLSLAYGNILLRGETLVASSNYSPFDYRFTHLNPGSTTGPGFLNWHDQGAPWWQWEPAAQFFKKAYRRGSIPLWDPSIGAGVDAHVNLTQGQYFPPYVLLLLLGNGPLLRDAYYLSLLFGSGVCCFLLLRRNGFHPVSGLTMGAVYMLSGPMTFNVNSLLGQAFSVIPLLVLATDWLLDHPTWSRSVGLALCVAIGMLASFWPIVISGLVLLPFQLVARRVVSDGTERRSLSRTSIDALRFCAGIALGIGLAAFLLVPVLMASRRDPHFLSWYSGVGLHHYSHHVFLTLVSPIVTYDVWQVADPNLKLFPNPYWPPFFYVGLTPLLLGVLARGSDRPRVRRLVIFFASAGLFVFLKLMGIPPVQWIAHLPVLKQIHFIPYFCGALAFCVAGLAGCAVERLRGERPSITAVTTVSVVTLAVFTLFIHFAATHEVNPHGVRISSVLEFARLALVAMGILFVAWLRYTDRLPGAATGVLSLSLVCLELVPLAYRDRYRRHDVWNDVPDYVRALQADPSLFRIHGVHDLALTANVYQGLGLSGISSRHALNPVRYDIFLRHFFDTAHQILPVATSLLPNRRVILDLLAVKYLITYAGSPSDEALLEAQGFELSTRDGEFAILRNTRVWPRAYITSQYRVVPDPDRALETVGTLTAPDEVVLEETPTSSPSTASGRAAQTECEVAEYGYALVRVRAKSDGPAVLVLSDSLAPGWRVQVNGRPSRLLAANYAFRGVEIPAGQSEVEFRYRTPGLRLGLAVSGLAVLTAAAILVASRRHARR